ncbi:MAG: ADP-ribosylglycohydrolase family protein [Burkholderiaceae bacterium]|nr:ADP-ribosylglycohydrolase family protein [Burkholderiaceae bacterium]
MKEHAHRPPARVAVGAEDFESAIVPAVNHSGDSDSTGAITGNLLGAAMGVEAIPERWLAPLELREAIGDMADDLATARPWCVGDESLESGYWWDRYPGCWPGDLCVGDSSRRICWCH